MKKVCLLFLVAVFSLATYAQKGAKYRATLAPSHTKAVMVNEPAPSDFTKAVTTNPVVKPKGIPSKNAKDVEVIELGSSGNIFGLIAGHKNALQWNSDLNTYSFTHRGGGSNAQGEAGGDYVHDISTDGGATWTMNVPRSYIQISGTEVTGRYPSGGIYNPAGNTDPANAWFVSGGVCHSGGWESAETALGHVKLDNSGQHDTVLHTTWDGAGRGMDLAYNYYVGPDGTCWIVGQAVNAAGSAGREYIDSIYMLKGQFNAGTQKFDWQMNTLYVPSLNYPADATKAYLSSVSIEFESNGLNGILGFDSWVDSNQYKPQNSTIWFMKTTDGGQTWGNPIGCPLHELPEIANFCDSLDVVPLFEPDPVPARNTWTYTTWGDVDMALDMDGNPHFIALLSFSPYTVDGSAGAAGYIAGGTLRSMFHIWYDMACGEWFSYEIGHPMVVIGAYAGLNDEQNRPYVMRSTDGTKLFFSYLDTDTISHPGSDNSAPDIHMVGFDAVTMTHTANINMTVGTDAEGIAHMGTAPFMVKTNSATEWEVPYVYASWDQATQNDAEYFFLKGFMVTNTDFAIANAITEVSVDTIAPTTFGGNDGSITVTVSCAVPVTSATICGVAGKAVPQAGKADYTFVFNGLAVGNYDIYFQNADGDIMMDTYTVPVSIAERSKLNANLNVAPNPAKDQLNVNFNIEGAQNVTVKLVSVNGQVAYAETFNANGNVNKTIDVSNYAQGIYFVQIVTANGVATQKVAIR